MKTRTVLRRRQAAAPVTVRTAGWITAGLLLATAGLGPAARSAAAASVDATPVNSGNPTCAEFAPSGASWSQFKLQDGQLANGTYTNGTLTVTISNYHDSSNGTPGSFDWAADQGIDAVFVKAGSTQHNLYVYDPEALSDQDLGPQAGRGNGISHISFCYDADATNPPATQTPSIDPTDPPSSDPTDPPASDPSDPPSSQPSDDPSSEPSTSPSTSPSTDPSDPPSTEPSDDPGASSGPNGDPTGQPSASPSSQPSSDPSDPPSSDPSDPPSSQPTDPPATDPTDPPTTDPTDSPSNDPSEDPSASPTSEVLGVTSGPKVTPPPTDTISAAATTGQGEAWRLVAIGLAMVLVSLLLMPSRRPARARTRR
jgi:hypothetical protein